MTAMAGTNITKTHSCPYCKAIWDRRKKEKPLRCPRCSRRLP